MMQVSMEEIVNVAILNLAHYFSQSDEGEREAIPGLAEGDWCYRHGDDYWSGGWCDVLASTGVMRRVHRYVHAFNFHQIEIGNAVPVKITPDSASIDCMIEVLCGIQFYDAEHRSRGLAHYGLKIENPERAPRAINSSFRNPPDILKNANPLARTKKFMGFSGENSDKKMEMFFEWVQLCSFGVLHRLGIAEIDEHGSLTLNVHKDRNSHVNKQDHCAAFLRTLN